VDGLHIAASSLLLDRATPSRLTAVEYERAKAGPPLRAPQVRDTPWDAELYRAMRRRGLGVHEEALLDRLLADLDTAGVSTARVHPPRSSAK